MEAGETSEPATSLCSFGGSVLFNDEGFEIFEETDGGAGSVGSVIELAGEGLPPSPPGKQPWQFINGMRAIEMVESKCYRTPHGFQKEATFPCQPLFEDSPNSSLSDSGILSSDPPQDEAQSSAGTSRREPLDRFTLMIGENILHFKIVKTRAQQSYPEVKFHPCPFCGKVLHTKVACETHISVYHNSSKELRCDTCGAVFSTKVSLALHMRYHSVPRPFRCGVCSKSFGRASTLALHTKMHMTGQRHFCQFCGKWFKSVGSLAEHENTCLAMLNGVFVNTDRPFRWQCSYCEKMFHHRRDKNIHERVHTGEKPYTCGYCGRGFSQSQTLTIHIRSHTGEKPYQCSICGEEFKDSSSLRKHEYKHATAPSSAAVPSLYEESTMAIEMDDERLWNGRNS